MSHTWFDLFRTRKHLDALVRSVDPEQTVPIRLSFIRDLVWDLEHLNSLLVIPPMPFQDGLISGGRVTWIANYDYEVSAAVYVIGGILHTSPLTMITLSPADALLDRIDTFILTSSNTADVIEGTPSAPPVLEPDVDVTTQLRIAFALVSANTTEPQNLLIEDIYLENTEWTTATGSPGTITLASLVNPYAGTKDIEATGMSNNQFITFTPTTFPILAFLDSLVFKIRSKAGWNNASSLQFQFRNGNVNLGNAVALDNQGTWGFLSALQGSYQNINIPLSAFGNISAATNLRIRKVGGGTIGFWLDNIQLMFLNNVPPPTQLNADWAATSGVTQIINKSATKTVAQVQGLAGAGTLDPNMWYVISNPQSSFGTFRVRAASTTTLERTGVLTKGGKTYTASYDLTANEFTSMYDAEFNNYVSRIPVIGYTNLTAFPWGNANWTGNTLVDCFLSITDPNKCVMTDSWVYGGNVAMNDNGGSQNCIISSSTLNASTVNLIGGNTNVTQIGSSQLNSAIVTLTDGGILVVNVLSGIDLTSEGTILNHCKMASGNFAIVITPDRAAGAYSHGEFRNGTFSGGGYSNFADLLSMANGAYNFNDIDTGHNMSYCGIIRAFLTGNVAITSFTNRDNNLNHPVTFYGFDGQTLTFTDNGTDIINIGSANAVLASTTDFITYRFVGNVAIEVARGIH